VGVRRTIVAAGWLLSGCVLCAALAAGSASAADYPSRVIKIVVPLAAGGPVDNAARAVVDSLSASLKQPVVIENKPGAGGNLGIGSVIAAPPDGHTLLMALGAQLTVNPGLYNPPPFDPATQLRPISILTASTQTLAVNPKVPAKTVAELVALAKQRPLIYGTSGFGTPSHITMEYLRSMAGFEATPVSYRGAASLALDLIAGQVQAAFTATSSIFNFTRDGRLRALAISGAKRSRLSPEIPTVAETYPGFAFESYILVLAPAGTPDDIVAVLEKEFHKAVTDPKFESMFRAHDVEPVGSSSAEASRWIAAETRRWSAFLKSANIKIN
jgi:tripartite-type tricarboxylate transporter receptor subunit TctC